MISQEMVRETCWSCKIALVDLEHLDLVLVLLLIIGTLLSVTIALVLSNDKSGSVLQHSHRLQLLHGLRYCWRSPWVCSVYKMVIIIIIIMCLFRWWTLPFLQACLKLVDSALDDRRLPDQCRVYCKSNSNTSGARCDTVCLIGGSNPLAKGPHWP